MKRNDYISWDEYFMGISLLSAQRSKDSHTQVGACIVSQDNKILSVGYNGMPTGCSDDEMPWDRNGEFLDTKYPFVCHAELNAILNQDICFTFSMQRMCKGYHSKRHKGSRLLGGQIR
jgi:dCMP deaminase